MEKRKEYTDPDSCLNRAADTEPIFVLRGQDMLSPGLVEAWASLAELNPDCDPRKIKEARDLAARMRAWPTRKMPD